MRSLISANETGYAFSLFGGRKQRRLRAVGIVVAALCALNLDTPNVASGEEPGPPSLKLAQSDVFAGDRIAVIPSGYKPQGISKANIVFDGKEIIGQAGTDSGGNVSEGTATIPLLCPPACAGAHAISLDIDPALFTTVLLQPAPTETVGPDASVFCTTHTASPPLGVGVDAGCNVAGATVTRTSPGFYTFSVPAQSPGGVVLVSTTGQDTVNCQVTNWIHSGLVLQIQVTCIAADASLEGVPVPLVPADSRMSVLWHRSDPAAPPATGYYAYAQVPLVSADSAVPATQFTSNGGGIRVQRIASGEYAVQMVGAPSTSELHIQVSAFGGARRRCSLYDVRLSSFTVNGTFCSR